MTATKANAGLSLKARAVALLAQREHSVLEMRSKLMRIAQRAAERECANAAGERIAAGNGDGDDNDNAREPGDAEAIATQVEAVLAWLQAQGYLDESRFVESRIHARAARFGQARIRLELAQHGLRLDEEQAARLKDSEMERAREVWRRRFGGELPQDAAERARQMRFLAARGFAAELIRRLLKDG